MKNTMHVQAHRGANKEAGENNIASIQCAAQMGVDSIEMDVQLTQDACPILVHDFYVDKGFISDFKQRELTRFPLLESVFQSFDQATASKIQWLDIEIKRDPKNSRSPSIEKVVDSILEVTKQHWSFDKVAFRSFDWSVLTYLHQKNPKCFIIPLLEKGTQDFSSAIQMKPAWIAPCFSDVNPTNLKFAHSKNVKVMPYTVNEPADWQKLIDWGVDGVTTDDPRSLLKILGRIS